MGSDTHCPGGLSWRTCCAATAWWWIYALFACWQVLGVWDRIESALRSRAAAAKIVVAGVGGLHHRRAHIHAAGASGQCGSRRRTRSSCAGTIARRVGHQDPRRDDQHRGVLTFRATPSRPGDLRTLFIPVLEQILRRPHPDPVGRGPARARAGRQGPPSRAPAETEGCAATGSGPPSRAPRR